MKTIGRIVFCCLSFSPFSKMTILLFLICFLLLFSGVASAATYYMCNTGATCGTGWSNGSNSNTGTSKAAPKLTLTGAFAVMRGGDTLIIGNGIYTGTSNMIGTYDTAVEPPKGTSSVYTTIKAENDGNVVFDGADARWMFYVVNSGARYWQFEGVIWARATENTVYIQDASYIKFLRCGAYDTAAGNHMNFSAGKNASYLLFEDCYAWGTGRYKFSTYHSDHVIFRRCVARPDGISAGGEPAAVFVAYSSSYVKFQNCIAVDADRISAWSNIGDRQGSFFVPCTDGVSQYIDFDQCIGLNVKLGGIQTAKNTDSANVNFTNVVIWDSTDDGTILNMIRGSSNSVNKCTFGNSGSTTYDAFYWDGGSGSITNSIMYHLLFTDKMYGASPATQDFNCYYANTNTTGRSGTHDITATNPIATSLKYLPQIELGSSLKGAGLNGSDIGANLLTLIGMSGTLWGETGYATDTGVRMWPFPNEDTIKTKMASYANGSVSGARGFAAGTSRDGSAQTLTKYIWEYLGNPIPTSIYGASLAVPTGLCVVNPATGQCF